MTKETRRKRTRAAEPASGPTAETPVRPSPTLRKSVYLVSYDLHSSHHDDDYGRVEDRIRTLGRTTRILYSQFLVQSERSADGVAEHVAELLEAEDHLFVTAVTDDMAWRKLAMGDERGAKWRHAARRR